MCLPKKSSDYLVILHLLILPVFGWSQTYSCEMVVPPFASNGVEVTHTLGENLEVIYEIVSFPLCEDSSLMISNSTPEVWLGVYDVWDSIWNPFKYTLQFSKPILSMDFIIYIGNGFLSGVKYGAEDFIFETNEASLNLETLFACGELIESDTLYLGIDSLTGVGSGLFYITFDCPVYEFTIRGKGGGSGSGFKICKNSLTTPYLWGRATGDTLVCQKDSVLLEAFGGVAPYTFSYNINGGATQTVLSSTPQVWLPTPSTAGTYTYQLLQVADGADSVAVIACNHSHTVQVANSPIAQFSLSPEAGVVPLAAQVSNSSANASSYSWYLNNSPLGINCPSANTCPVNITDTGSFLFTLVASNTFGCTDTATATFTAFAGLEVVVPNVFTPNNDGANDWFGITTSIAATAEVTIVNRWGNVVFEKAFSTKSDTFIEVWNGASIPIPIGTEPNIQIGFNAVNDGTYFYKIKVSPLESNREAQELSGFVEVVR